MNLIMKDMIERKTRSDRRIDRRLKKRKEHSMGKLRGRRKSRRGKNYKKRVELKKRAQTTRMWI